MQRPSPSKLTRSGRQGIARGVAKRRLATSPVSRQASRSRQCRAARSYMTTHTSTLSPLLSSPGWGGVLSGETEERVEGTTLLLHVLLCECMCPCPFLLVPCKCRASASLRMLAKKCYNGGEDHGTRGPPFFAAAAHGAVGGGVHMLVAGSLGGRAEPPAASSLRLEQIEERGRNFWLGGA